MTDDELRAAFQKRVEVSESVWRAVPSSLGAGTLVRAMIILSSHLHGDKWPGLEVDLGVSLRDLGLVYELKVTREMAVDRLRALHEELDRRLPGATA